MPLISRISLRPLAGALTLLASLALPSTAEACTSLMATPGATADGSSLATYAADSHTLYGELYFTPGATHAPGSMRIVTEWDTGRRLGEIPQPPTTFRTVGNMNEHGLTIAESTWGGREELVNPDGLIDYGSLIYITLERARTAPEAVRMMTQLVQEYGYCSEGESFTIADPQEVWIMEMIGRGKGEKGALWVARKVPDGYICGHANQARIHSFPLDDPETLYSPDIISFAREKGWFTGADEDFSFSLAYCPPDFGTIRGCDARVWAFFNKFAPGMDRYLPYVTTGKGEVFPLWVKPSRPLTVNDMQEMMRDHFEGTPLDMTQDVGAGPFKVPYRSRPMEFEVDGKKYFHERAIATQQTGFSFVAQMNALSPKGMDGILWFGVDDANTSVYVPMYAALASVPRPFEHGNGDLLTLSWDSAFWVNNFVANQAYFRYSRMIPDIRRVQGALEKKFHAETDSLRTAIASLSPQEAARALDAHSHAAAAEYHAAYKALGEYLLVKHLDFNIKAEKDGTFERTPEGLPARPAFGGYDDPRYFEGIVRDTGDRLRIPE